VLGERREAEADVIGKLTHGHLAVAQVTKNQQSLLVGQGLEQLRGGIGALRQRGWDTMS